MTKAKAESKDRKSQTHRHIFTTTTINSRLFLVAFECKTNFHSIALSHLPVPLSPCLAVSLSCCLCLRLPWPHVKVPAAALQCQQLLGNNNSSRGTATTARVLHMSGIPSIPYARHSSPQHRLPTDHSHW